MTGPAAPTIPAGAELDWIAPWDGLTPLEPAMRSAADELIDWLRTRDALTAAELE